MDDLFNRGQNSHKGENPVSQAEQPLSIPGQQEEQTAIDLSHNPESQGKKAKEDKIEKVLPLEVALHVLMDMVKNLTGPAVLSIKAVPLLVKLAEMSVANSLSFHWGNVNLEMVRVGEAIKKCLFCLLECVKKHSNSFTEAQFAWLQHEAGARGLLETALLKPLMSPPCDRALHGGIGGLTIQITEQKGHYWLTVAQLLHISVAHPEMSQFVASDIQLVKLQVDRYGADLGLFHLLVNVLPSEMREIGPALLALAQSQQKPWFADHEITLLGGMASMLNRDVYYSIQACEMLTCSVMRWCALLVTEETMCHILINYREAFKSIFSCVVSGSFLCVVAIAQHCTLLSSLVDPAASVVENSTMLLLDRLKTIIRARLEASREIPFPLNQEVQMEIDWVVSSVRDAIVAVKYPRTQQVLLAQLAALYA